MPTPANSGDAVYGQLYNFSISLVSTTTNDIKTGGLSGLAATISKDDGTFASTANTPVEIATQSGIVSLDLTATEMTCSKAIIKITATGCYTSAVQIAPDDLRGTYTDLFTAQSVIKPSQMWKQIWQYLFNRNVLDGAQQTLYNDANIALATCVVTAGNGNTDKEQMS